MANSIVSSIIKSYNGRSIRVNPNDRYVCLTDMAAASGKRLNNWIQTDKAKSYIETLSVVTGKPVSALLSVTHGNLTWAHPKVAIRFAQWCSDEFAVQVDFWIDELVTTGSVSIATSDRKSQSWIQAREDGKLARREFTDKIASFNPTAREYAIATNQAYLGITGKTAAEIKQERNVAKSRPARDGLDDIELAAVRLTELAVARNESISNSNRLYDATLLQAQAIGKALQVI